MSNTIYMSSIGTYMTAFLSQRRQLGYKAYDVEYALRSIDYYLLNIGFTESFITKEVYDGWWKSTENQINSTRYSKASIFIRFIKYLTMMGIDCYVPRLPRKHESGRTPYTFTESEMASIFVACDKLRMKERHTKSVMIGFPALIRLMYSTAIRISEALEIRLGNVDFNHHVIKLEYTKNGHQRLAPINNSLEIVLRQYLKYRLKLPYNELSRPNSYLFVSSQGKKISRKSCLKYMHRVLEDAGIAHIGNEEGPHLHNIRHSACVHSMIKCCRNGMDIYCGLPIISTFMGHCKVLDTEKYLRLTQEMYPDLIKQDLSITSIIQGTVKRAKVFYDEESL